MFHGKHRVGRETSRERLGRRLWQVAAQVQKIGRFSRRRAGAGIRAAGAQFGGPVLGRSRGYFGFPRAAGRVVDWSPGPRAGEPQKVPPAIRFPPHPEHGWVARLALRPGAESDHARQALNHTTRRPWAMRGYSYDEAVEFDDVTPVEARQEVERHSLDFSDFLTDVGTKTFYTGQEVLDWLGY